MKTDVTCIGILVADVIAKPVDTLPQQGLLERIDFLSLHSGGCAMTAAVNLAKMGLNAAIAGKIGQDSFGNFLQSTLIKYGVNTKGLSYDSEVQTSASVVLSSPSGERSFLHCVGANGTFGMEDISWDLLFNSKIVFVSGTFLMDAFDGVPCARVLKKCKEKGITTVLDTAWDSQGRWMDLLSPCLPYVDVFLPSIDEAKALTGKKDPFEISEEFFHHGVGAMGIKLGSKGCYLRENAKAAGEYLPTYPAPVVDTTGAGDSFCSGFIAGLIQGFSFSQCGRLANVAGTHCVSALGATEGMKPLPELLKWMEEQG